MTQLLIPGRLALVTLMLIGTAAGCSKGDRDRYPVSGVVQIGGEPVRGGFVIFEPMSAARGGGRQGFAPIRDGRFDTREGGEPAAAGPVMVRVQGWGAPSDRFPSGVPVCANYEINVELESKPNTLELKIPESARVKEPPGGWGNAP